MTAVQLLFSHTFTYMYANVIQYTSSIYCTSTLWHCTNFARVRCHSFHSAGSVPVQPGHSRSAVACPSPASAHASAPPLRWVSLPSGTPQYPSYATNTSTCAARQTTLLEYFKVKQATILDTIIPWIHIKQLHWRDHELLAGIATQVKEHRVHAVVHHVWRRQSLDELSGAVVVALQRVSLHVATCKLSLLINSYKNTSEYVFEMLYAL